MEFSIKAVEAVRAGQTELIRGKTDALVLGLFEGVSPSGAAKAADQASGGLIGRLIKAGDFTGKRGSQLLLSEPPGMGAARLMLVGLGKEEDFKEKAFVEAVRIGARVLAGTKARQAVWNLDLPRGRCVDWAAQTAVQTVRDLAYDFIARNPGLKTKTPPSAPALRKLTFAVNAKSAAAARAAIARGAAVADGVDFARDLDNLPANICTPTYLAEQARAMARRLGVKAEVLGRKQIEALKMGAFLSVTAGTGQPPQFIVLRYQGAAATQAPVVLVGKGITFDTGGISLKPGEGMDEMKFDMCGAASVLGTMAAVATMKLKINLVVLVPTCENMPSGVATKPGDVVVTMSGQTVEILNTDAEGRLILCDALTYAERFKPAAVIDVATLTGACVIALGHVNSGLYANQEELADDLLAAGRDALDTAWRMPLDEEYQEQLKSNFADMANIGGRPAGSVTAACYLSRFAGKYNWAHLDIAGTAWKSGAAKGATGRPVPLLTRYLSTLAK
ncbi:MAG: leucyl aminopeptidase [Candidatus Protistobacter heckmanni]|nr:leucyl aminopeptidase [Candidatus Protistobacter heckmanni]